MKQFIIITSLFLWATTVLSQKSTISGYVESTTTGERLIYASVFLPENGNGTATNNFGYFSITVDVQDSIKLRVGFTGYALLDTTINSNKTEPTIFKLNENTLISEVSVNATEKHNEKSETHSIPIKLLTELPSVFAETDVIKGLQLLPGVSGGSESSNNLVVRGGSPDQNLVMLDDVPIYHLNHLGGIVSVFDEHAINNITLIKGGFSGKYGGRLSSVVDIRSRSGNPNKYQTRISVGTLTTKLATEGGFANKKASYLFSGRMSNFNYFVKPISRIALDATVLSFGFYDLNGKLTYRLNSKNRLSVNLYSGNDNMGMLANSSDENQSYNEEDRYEMISKSNNRWGNTLGSLRWNRNWGGKLFSNLVLAGSAFGRTSSMDMQVKSKSLAKTLGSYNTSNYSGITDWLAKLDVEYSANDKLKVNTGLHYTQHVFTPLNSEMELSINDSSGAVEDNLFYGIESSKKRYITPKEYIHNSVAYIDLEYNPNKYIQSMFGLRISNYLIGSYYYSSAEPRLRLSILPIKSFKLFASYTHMSQPMHLLVGSGMGQPTDRWVPATNKTKVERAEQVAVGMNFSGIPFGLSIEFDVYHKTMSGLIYYKNGENLYSGGNWEENIETGGIGTAYGAEALLKKEEGRLTGWLSYTWANSNRYFENLNMGLAFPYRYDRRHDISLVSNYKINQKISLSALWVFSSGNHVTLGSYKYDAIRFDNVRERRIVTLNESRYMPEEYYFTDAHIYPGINNYQLPSYHRFDFSFSFKSQTKRNNSRVWKLGVYNSYNRMNPFMVYFYTNNRNNETVLEQITLFPFMPFVNYSLAF